MFVAWSLIVFLTPDADSVDRVDLKRGYVVARLLGLRVRIPHRVHRNLLWQLCVVR
jgi:hypothetical protein